MIPVADRWGPFADGLEPGERLARLLCLRAIVHLLCGPRGLELQASIRVAERGQTMGLLSAVLADLDALAATDRRHVLACYAALIRDDIDRLCRERSRPADNRDDYELLRLGEEIDRAAARWRVAVWRNREPQERLQAFLANAEKRPGGATVADHKAAWALPGVKEANEAEDQAYEAIFKDLGNRVWSIPATTLAGLAVKARVTLATYFGLGSYEEDAALGEGEDCDPKAIRGLIQACCTLAGVDWRGDPIALNPTVDPSAGSDTFFSQASSRTIRPKSPAGNAPRIARISSGLSTRCRFSSGVGLRVPTTGLLSATPSSISHP